MTVSLCNFFFLSSQNYSSWNNKIFLLAYIVKKKKYYLIKHIIESKINTVVVHYFFPRKRFYGYGNVSILHSLIFKRRKKNNSVFETPIRACIYTYNARAHTHADARWCGAAGTCLLSLPLRPAPPLCSMGELQIEISNMKGWRAAARGKSNPLMCYMCKFTGLLLQINAFPFCIQMYLFSQIFTTCAGRKELGVRNKGAEQWRWNNNITVTAE